MMPPKKSDSNLTKKPDIKKVSNNLSWISIVATIAVVLAVMYNSMTGGKERYARSPIARRDTSSPAASTAQPTAFPSGDQSQMITGSYLTDPFIVNALDYVNSVADPTLLAIPNSTYIQYAIVNYTADSTATCYWPEGQCTRHSSGNWGAADIIRCSSNYQWGLSFDDAPSYHVVNGSHVNDTRVVLNQLVAMDLKATFFVIGASTLYFPSEIQALANASMHIASHTWTHHPLTSLTNAQIVAEMMYTQALIYKETGLLPRYFRPPYGDIDDRVRAILNALGFRIVIWEDAYDSRDSDVSPSNPASWGTVMGVIHSWFGISTPFISLNHVLSQFTCGTSLQMLLDIVDAGGVSNQLMPVPQCTGDSWWYWNKQVTTWYNSCTRSTCTAAESYPSTTKASKTPSGSAGPAIYTAAALAESAGHKVKLDAVVTLAAMVILLVGATIKV